MYCVTSLILVSASFFLPLSPIAYWNFLLCLSIRPSTLREYSSQLKLLAEIPPLCTPHRKRKLMSLKQRNKWSLYYWLKNLLKFQYILCSKITHIVVVYSLFGSSGHICWGFSEFSGIDRWKSVWKEKISYEKLIK